YGNNTFGGDNVAIRYRGIEHPFGNYWMWLDGINVNDAMTYTCNNPAYFAYDTATNYTYIGDKIQAEGWISKHMFSTNGDIIPVAVNGSESTYMCDYYWYNTGWRVAYVGGLFRDGSDAGLGCVAANLVSSDVYTFIGARLCYIPGLDW
ncbi:MAG TPA: hypothetical protein DDY68_04760, partial [Porphyromonadaceae bacterium]|nr:hypothetical protein [Porphyromonadaceae bacterium]